MDLVKGQRPGTIPAWANGPGYETKSNFEGQRPVPSIGFVTVRRANRPGLQPSVVFGNGSPGALPQAGMKAHLWCSELRSCLSLRRGRKELLHQPAFVGLEGVELVTLGGHQGVERGEAGSYLSLFVFVRWK